MINQLEKKILNRSSSPYLEEFAERMPELKRQVSGKRILAIGAAGSIGAETVKKLLHLAPASICVVDVNENGLAELIRQLRSSDDDGIRNVADFRTIPLDFGSPIFRRFLASEGPFDIILNFAAIKHVRSEKDVFSILHMIDTNILKPAQVLSHLAEQSWSGRYFSVSTDKAANPSSLMGATKRLMEHVMFHRSGYASGGITRTSARFANVAFSNGSLLQSFETRLRERQLLACPVDIKRYFVTLAESGAICALASLLVDDGHIAIPNLDPEENLVLLTSVAQHFLESRGIEAVFFHEEEEARAFLRTNSEPRKYPVFLTPADTAGEKPYEEFVAANESVKDVGLLSLRAVRHAPPQADMGPLLEKLTELRDGVADGVDKLMIKELIASIEPDFARTHIESEKSLDQRA
ncbi:MAG: polysaccharide biosynthesis protein [Rhizobiaceae bacterium]